MRRPSGPIAPATYGGPARGLARKTCSDFVDVVKTLGEAKCAQLDPVGTEGVGLEHVCTRLRVGMVHRQDALGVAQVQGVE